MIRRATVAKFSYRLDVGRTDGKTIPLGLLAKFHDDAGQANILAVFGRTELKPSERAEMDWAAQQTLTNPLEFFGREVDAALKEGVQDIFAYLSQKFTWSIYVSPSADVPVPAEIAESLMTALSTFQKPPKKMSASKNAAKARASEVVYAKSAKRAPVPSAAPTFSALARMVAPEFQEDRMSAYLPPAWVAAHSNDSRSLLDCAT